MDISLLRIAVDEIKSELEQTIRTANYNGQRENGQQAKQALIRSQNLIMKIHEVVKISLKQELEKFPPQHYTFHPPLGERRPELVVSGHIKPKKQDIVVLFGGKTPETIKDGPLEGALNSIGREQSENAIIIGVRSQLSSVAKNFDTLIERAMAEPLNLRLRLPKLVMGEVYVLPVVEYDDQAMKQNCIAWKPSRTPVEKFIKTFLALTHRDINAGDPYKYERSALIVVDFQQSPVQIFLTLQDLKKGGYISPDFKADFDLLSPINFAADIVNTHRKRHLYLY